MRVLPNVWAVQGRTGTTSCAWTGAFVIHSRSVLFRYDYSHLYSHFLHRATSGGIMDGEEEKKEAPKAPAILNEEGRIAYLDAIVTRSILIENAIAKNQHIDVWLVRGGGQESCLTAINAGSAGGEPENEACGKPTLEQVISQVGGSRPGVPQEKLPEFTSVARNSAKWARRGGWLLVKINTKYLAAGDAGESGWICLKSAPLLNAKYIPHPNPVAAVGGGRAIPNGD